MATGVGYLLRKFNLLGLIDYLTFLMNVLTHRKSNQDFLAMHPDFIPPPVHLAYEAYNYTNWKTYYISGLSHSHLISDLIKEYISIPEIKICEWGCGPARVIRNLKKIKGYKKIELFGTDYNEKSINWCKEYIKDISFSKNILEPPLPFKANFFDCVYAISVFTHLSERMHNKWIKELFRIIKPGGILIFTTHGEIYANKLLPAEKRRYDSGCFVQREYIKEGSKHFAAFQPSQFIKKELLKDHIVLKHIKDASDYHLPQEVWCVKKKL